MHVGDRSTWLNSEALSRDKDIFLEKRKIRLFCTAYTRIRLTWSKGDSLKRREKISWKKILEKKLFK